MLAIIWVWYTPGLKVNHDAGLLECDFGEWTSAAIADLAALPQWQTVQHSPSAVRFPNGESFPQMQARIVGALEVLCTAHAGGVIVCFSHADPIKAAVAHALGTHPDLFQRIVVTKLLDDEVAALQRLLNARVLPVDRTGMRYPWPLV